MLWLQSLNLDYDAALIKNEDLAWFAVNNSKPSRMNNYCLLVNSSYDYASKNINTSNNGSSPQIYFSFS